MQFKKKKKKKKREFVTYHRIKKTYILSYMKKSDKMTKKLRTYNFKI